MTAILPAPSGRVVIEMALPDLITRGVRSSERGASGMASLRCQSSSGSVRALKVHLISSVPLTGSTSRSYPKATFN